jgi:flagellar motor switch protein FliN/FliY
MKQLIAVAQGALTELLSTILGEEAPLTVDLPVETAVDELASPAQKALYVMGSTDPGFVIQLSPDWLLVLSKAMMGEEIKAGDEGFEEFVSEILEKAYDTLRSSLSPEGISLPETSFSVIPEGGSIPTATLPASLWKVALSMSPGGRSMKAAVYLPSLPEVSSDEPEVMQEQAGASPTPASAAAAASSSVPVSALQFPDLGKESIGDGGHSFGLLADVELVVTVELGRRRLPLADILRLTNGSVIELEKLVGEPLEVFANGRHIAHGEAVVIDEQFGIRITALASPGRVEKAFP